MPTPEAAAERALMIEQLRSEQTTLTLRIRMINRVAVVIVGAFGLLISVALLIGLSNGRRVQEQADRNTVNATIIAGLVLQVAQAQQRLQSDSCVAYISAVGQTANILYAVLDTFPATVDADKARSLVAAQVALAQCPINNPAVVVPPSLAGATAPTTIAGPLG